MNERWQVALHESGHAVAALALGGTCSHVVLFPNNRGLATLDELTPYGFAIATAAGPTAEEVLADEAAPPDPAPSAPVRRDICDPAAAELSLLAARFPADTGVNDSQAIARYCIARCEVEPPERWVERFHAVHARAHRVVSDHHQQILAVARALFARGVLHQPDIEKEMGIT